MIFEYPRGGHLIGMLMDMEPMGENAGRFFVRQLVTAVQDMHKQGVAHRDLKPENIMLDQALNIKLIDFGLASRLNDLDTDIKKLSTVAGTPQYQAPEIFEQDTYDGLKADMFSIGVILFMIVIKSYPFKNSDKNDKFYRLIMKNTEESFEAYWDRLHERFCKRGVNIKGMALGFKQLVFRLLCHNPDERMTINELK